MNLFKVKWKSLWAVSLLSFAALSVSAKDVLYVKSGASGNGSSWSSAFGNVQQAVDAAAEKGADVWVAKGVYKGDSVAVVSLKPGVNLYGGFSGNETSLSVRDTAKNPTILDGDGKMQVVVQNEGFEESSAVVVDGFTIRNGYAENGGGVYVNANTTLNNCIVTGNKSSGYGSAIYAQGAKIKNLQIIDNTFEKGLYYTVYLSNSEMDSCAVLNNSAYYSAAVYGEKESLVTNCDISGNVSSYSSSYGSVFSASKVRDCKFVNTKGRGASVSLGSSSVMEDCLFQGNAGANTFLVLVDGKSVVQDCQILDNSCESSVLYIQNGKVYRCLLKGNTTTSNLMRANSSSSYVSNCLVCDNVTTSSSHDLVYLYSGTIVRNCTFARNKATGGNIVGMSNAALLNSIVVGNEYDAKYSCPVSTNGSNTIRSNMLESAVLNGNVIGTMKIAAFTDAENGDYSLSENSYCINAGENTADTVDFFGNKRNQGGAVDLGAIESSYTSAPEHVKCNEIIFVKEGAQGDGSSWESAFGDVQQAILAASADKKKHQIWVAKGTYYGDSDSHVVVNLVSGISLYGGFAGDETSLAARDTAKNPTVLDGRGVKCVISQNYGFYASQAVVVDGFTIRNGYSANGGGVNINENTTINNCIITSNKATTKGSAIYATNATIKNTQIIGNDYTNSLSSTVLLSGCVMDSCAVRFNKAYYTGAVNATNSKVTNCVFEGNTSGRSSSNVARGSYFSNTQVSNCKFVNANGYGASIDLEDGSVMNDCLIEGNTDVGLPIVLVGDSKTLMYDCQILNNSASASLLSVRYGSVERCVVKGNTTSSYLTDMASSAIVSNCLFCDNICTLTSYDALMVEGKSSMINCTVVRNKIHSPNVIKVNNSTLKNSILVGNKMEGNYVGIVETSGTSYVITNNMLESTSMDGNVEGTMAYAAFTDAENGDYSLSENSFCINAGTAVTDTIDLLGNARTQGGAVDMGAIESSYTKAPSSSTCNEIVYVKVGSTGDGSSWQSAFGDIQQAIITASSDGRRHQIWVAAGTYYGDTTLSTVVNLASGISLYGGFAGTETSLAARDTAKNPTILDGMNVRRCVTQNHDFVDSMAVVVDGFTIRNGYAANGGGVYLSANATLNNCIVRNCHVVEYGMAVYSKGGRVTNSVICDNGSKTSSTVDRYGALYLDGGMVDSCVVVRNYSYYTGALQAKSASISNTLFEGNEVVNNYVIDLSKSSLSDCRIINNVCEKDYAYVVKHFSNSTMERCLVDGNVSNSYTLRISGSVVSNSQITQNKVRKQGLVYLGEKSTIVNCTVTDNESAGQTVYCYNSGNQILNSIIVGNKRSNNSENIYVNGTTINYSMVEGGANGEGNIDGSFSSAAFTDPSKGDYSLKGTSLCINAGTDVADTLDLLGKARKQSDAVDMGAIESAFTGRATIGSIVYVKAGAEGSGLSWDDALGEINQAVTLASMTGEEHQIWVAKGTYFGDTALSSAISLAAGVSLYGGFDGTESSLDERNVANNLTVIDGQGKRRCVVQNYDFADSLAIVVDGFTIRNGKISGVNGVIAKTKKNATFRNCVFESANEGNVSVYAEKTSLVNCEFIGGKIRALEIYDGVVDSCSFIGNDDQNGGDYVAYLDGSRMTNSRISDYQTNRTLYATDNSTVSYCKFMNNKTKSGNAVYLNKSSLENSLVCGNEVNVSGYSIISVSNASSIINTTIAHNTTKNRSAISYSSSSSGKSSSVVNSIIYGNKVTDDVRPQVVVSDYVKVSYCASDGDLTGEHNIKLATSNSGSDASQNYVCFINAAGGDYRLHATSSCIDKGLDSLMKAETDINGAARIYGAAIDLGAAEFDGEYVQMLDYSQVVCHNRYSLEATFDSTISKIAWSVARAGKVSGFESNAGSGTAIPSMRLHTTKDDIDTLTLNVTPYDKAGVAGSPFVYNYFVYPDFSAEKIVFSLPVTPYVLNEKSTSMTINWKLLSLPVEVDNYDLYVWKASQKMPSAPMASFVKGHDKSLSGLDNHTTYKYMVKAVVACDTICSEIDSFRIDIPVCLEISGSSICELGTKLNASTYLRKSIKGFELTDSITYTITGADAADFSVTLSNQWNSLTGGNFNIYYTPTDSKKASSSATLTFKSGNYTATLYLSGVLANYYVYDAVVENDVYRAGDTIPVKATVTDAYGVPFVGKRLKVYLLKGGSEIKSMEAVSDENGVAWVNYESSLFECGVYYVGVCLSGESSNESFDVFDIPGISCNVGTDKWLVQRGDTVYGTITVRNHSNVEARDIKVRTLTLADGCKVEFDSIDVLYGLDSKKIKYCLTGDKLTEGTRYLPSSFRVESAEGLKSEFTSYFYCEMPYGQIKVLPANIKEYVSKQKPKYIDLMLCNTGFGETGKVTVALPDGFEGMSLPNGTEIESIKSGDTVRTTLKLAYYDGAKLNTPINGSIGFNCENGKSTSITYSMEYTSSLVGSVVVDVVDEYFYNSASKSHLAGAEVEIKNAFNSKVIVSGITDSTGRVRFDSVPEGEYLLAVKADKHSNYKESVSVQAGQTLNKFVFLSYQAVTYTWNVERTEIEDKYEIEIESEYETNVPVPVVTARFPNGLPSRESFNPGDKKVAYLEITNYGLIAAKNVAIETPEMEYFTFTPDVDRIDSLPANFSVVVPVTIERLTRKKPCDDCDSLPKCDDCDSLPKPCVNCDCDDCDTIPEPIDDTTCYGCGPGPKPGEIPGDSTCVDCNPDQDPDKPNNPNNPDNPGGDPYGGQPNIPDIGVDIDTLTDCTLIIIKYTYECGELVEKKTYVKTWKCTSSSPSGGAIVSGGGTSGGYGYGGGFGGYGGTFVIGISTYKEKDCEESCEDQIDGWKSCLWDLIGWIPVVGDLAEGAYRETKTAKEQVSDTWKTVKDIHTIVTEAHDAIDDVQSVQELAGDIKDAVVNGISGRNIAKHAYNVLTTKLSEIPVYGDFIPFGCLDWLCQALSCDLNDTFASNCGQFIYDLAARGVDSLVSHHNEKHNNVTRSLVVEPETTDFYELASPYMLASHDFIEYYAFEIYRRRLLMECVGSEEALMKAGMVDFLDLTIDSISEGGKIDIEKVKKLPVSDLSMTDMIAISERWNRSIDAWKDSVYESNEQYPNIVSKKNFFTHLEEISNFYQYVLFRGFNSVEEMVLFIDQEMANHKKQRKSVCASVKLHISQTLTMTREAFDGTLTVNNGSETMDMDNFAVVLDVRDEKGNPANDLFQINTQSLKGVSAVNGTSAIGAGKEATAVFRFIPERGAAPKEPVNYSFGGKIVYLEAGDTITLELDPVTLTVYPSPDLQIDYFMQRNILGDDAMTLDRVEPSVPAALGVRIDNQGYGMAKNVKLETAQPEIVDNKKGLLIDFAIIGSSLDGKDCDLGSENIDFGNIDAQSTKTGVWWLTSSLLGHFTKYEASVVHANSFGNPELSLVRGIAIHELIKTVDAYGVKEDGVIDFLVNDYEDANDTPDAIYYSNGGKDTVYVAKSTKLDKEVVTDADSVIRLTVTPSLAGWNYAQMADPGDNFYEIKKIVRVKDSVEIPLDNVWTTFVTLPDGIEPVYENRLHFLDYMTVLGENDYDLYYKIRRNILAVSEITGSPSEETFVTVPVDSVVVTFNRKIQKETFDYHDIEFYCQASENLSDSTITVTQLDDYSFVVNFSSKTKITGHYKLEVNVTEILDQDGNPGEFGKGVAWTQFIEGTDPYGDPTPFSDVEKDTMIVYAYDNCIYVKSTKAGALDVYDMLSRLVVENARYGEGVTCVATLPKGVYIVKGKKVIVE